MSERRRYRELHRKQSGSPTLEVLTRRKPSRRFFRTLSTGNGYNPPPSAPVANYPILRYMRLLGPIPPELGTEDTPWIEQGFPGPGSRSTTHCITWAYEDPFVYTPDERELWTYRSYPMRFAIEGNQTYWEGNVSRILQGFVAPVFPVTGLSSVLPPSNSHVSLNTTQMRITTAAYWHAFYQFSRATMEVFTTHYRVWVDSVDKTGIVALSTAFGHGALARGFFNFGGLMPPVAAILGNNPGSTVWVDLWTKIQVYDSGPDYTPIVNGRRWICGVDPTCGLQRNEFLSGNVNARRSAGDQYKYTFSNNGPESLSVLTPTTSGWTFTETNASQTIQKNSVGRILFNWAPESPVLELWLNAQNNQPFPPTGPVVRYMPVDSGDYQIRTSQSGAVMRTGVWNPNGATVFQQVARLYNGSFLIKGSGQIPDSYFTAFPTTITVEKV